MKSIFMPRVVFTLFVAGLGLLCTGGLPAEESSQTPPQEVKVEEPWIEPIPVPTDPELEHQIQEIQEALGIIHQQMVRRKEALNMTQDATTKATLYDEFERLRKEREELEQLLHELVDEAKLSEQTALDEALARARWLERQEEIRQQREEIIRDRQP